MLRFSAQSGPRREIARHKRTAFGAAIILIIGPSCSKAYSSDLIDKQTIKKYAYMVVISKDERLAMDYLYDRESNWNPNSVNGSHYGICQGKSKYLSRVNYRKQFHWCYRYVMNRYGSYQMALLHWWQYGWH